MKAPKSDKSVSDPSALMFCFRKPSGRGKSRRSLLVKPDHTLRCGCEFHTLHTGLTLLYMCKKHVSLAQ